MLRRENCQVNGGSGVGSVKEEGCRKIALAPTTARPGQLVQTPVAVEKLLLSKSTKIKTRQEALQSIFSGRLDIFYPPNFGELRRRVSFSTATPVFANWR
jgi:hypothetical protein